jgi:membrane associated rhomboid family serine protease
MMTSPAGGGRPERRLLGGTSYESPAARAKGGLLMVGSFVALLFIIEVVNMLMFRSLNQTFGLRPRSADGLLDIFTFPLLHASITHLLSNTLPLIIFGFLVLMSGLRVFLTAAASSWLGSGLMVWLIGDRGITVGASGLVFGLFAFLLVRGFFNRNWWQILLSVVLFLAYGGILFGVLPFVAGYVSWQAHLGGALGGVAAAVILRPKGTGTSRLRSPQT